jgi:hypothetical protein
MVESAGVPDGAMRFSQGTHLLLPILRARLKAVVKRDLAKNAGFFLLESVMKLYNSLQLEIFQ